MKKKIGIHIAMVVCAAVFLFSAGKIVWTLAEQYKEDKAFSDLAAKLSEVSGFSGRKQTVRMCRILPVQRTGTPARTEQGTEVQRRQPRDCFGAQRKGGRKTENGHGNGCSHRDAGTVSALL